MAQAVAQLSSSETRSGVRMAVVAWVLTAVYYFYQYVLRSAPAVMMPELSNAFNITPLGVASIVVRWSTASGVAPLPNHLFTTSLRSWSRNSVNTAVPEGDRTSSTGEITYASGNWNGKI